MKRIIMLCLLIGITARAPGQWTSVQSALITGKVTSISTWVDTILVSTDGGGIFRSTSQGGGWLDVSGNIASRDINWIRGGGHYEFLWVGTADGAYHTPDLTIYTDKSVGLPNRDVSFYGRVADNHYITTTLGGGLFSSQTDNGPWTAFNTGLTAAGQVINAFTVMESGAVDVFAIGTNDGFYYSNNNLASWTNGNVNLSGDALKVTDITSFGGAGYLYSTRSGLYFYLASNDTTYGLLPGEKLNTIFYYAKGQGLEGYVFGEKGFFDSNGGLQFSPVDMTGITGGEVTCVAKTSEFLFVGTESGGVFKMALGGGVTPDPVTAAFTANPTSGNAPLTVQFTDQSTTSGTAKGIGPSATAITSWEWDFDNDGVIDSDDPNPSHFYTDAGFYSVSLTVSDGTNTDKETKHDYISISPGVPQISMDISATPRTGAAPLTVQFNDLSQAFNMTITQWEWDFDNDGTIDSDDQNPSYVYDTPGTYSVKLELGDGVTTNNETYTDYITVSAAVAELSAGFSSSPLTGAAPLTVNFKDTSKAINTTINSWSWDFDNNGTEDANIQFPWNTYQQPGSYSVRLIVSDGTLSDTVTKVNYLTVTADPVVVNTDFSGIPTSGTAPLTVQFTDASTADNTTINSWAWDFDGNGTVDSGAQNPSHIYSTPGMYTVLLRAGDGSNWDSEAKQAYITVTAVPSASVAADFKADPTGGFAPLTVQFTDTSTANNTSITSWLWDFQNDGVVDATVKNPEWTFAAADTYTVSLTVGDGSQSDTEIKTDYIQVVELVYPSTITVTNRVTYPVQSDVSDFATTDYRMFGVPGNSGMSLADFIGTPYDEKWQAFFDNGAAQDYMIEFDQSAIFALTTGRAFWLLHNGPVNMDQAVIAAPLDNDNHAAVPLQSGWNLITNPFVFALNWQAVQEENGITGEIYTYDGAFTQSLVMEPFYGYYYFNENNLSVLKIPYYAAIAKKTRPAIEELPDIGITTRLFTGKRNAGEIRMGIRPDTQIGFDRFDTRKPRDLGGVPEILFHKPTWDSDYPAFSADMRPELHETNQWDFEIRNGRSKKLTLQIDLDEKELDLTGMDAALVDWSGGVRLPLPLEEAYSITGMSNLMKFSVYLGDAEQIEKQLAAVLPKTFALSQNYPNPFNHETLFTFSAPRAANIDVLIFNALGQRVASVFSGPVTAGHHVFKWNGRNDFGNIESSGLFFLVVSYDSKQHFSKKLILLK